MKRFYFGPVGPTQAWEKTLGTRLLLDVTFPEPFPRGNGNDSFKMADEEEDDYMSDKFLLGAAENTPGLVPDKIAKKYKREMKHNELNQRNKIKPMRVRETEHRELGLASALNSSNKGFAMLQKMGFKHGMGLGKDGILF